MTSLPMPKDLEKKAGKWFCLLRRPWPSVDELTIPPNKLQPSPEKPMEWFKKNGLRIEKGDGRKHGQFPFMSPEEDFRLYQPPQLLDVLNATVSWLYNPGTDNTHAYKQLALVIYPCDISQYEGYKGTRGKTLIPYQLAALDSGLQLIKNPGRHAYLPANWTIEDIPLSAFWCSSLSRSPYSSF